MRLTPLFTELSELTVSFPLLTEALTGVKALQLYVSSDARSMIVGGSGSIISTSLSFALLNLFGVKSMI